MFEIHEPFHAIVHFSTPWKRQKKRLLLLLYCVSYFSLCLDGSRVSPFYANFIFQFNNFHYCLLNLNFNKVTLHNSMLRLFSFSRLSKHAYSSYGYFSKTYWFCIFFLRSVVSGLSVELSHYIFGRISGKEKLYCRDIKHSMESEPYMKTRKRKTLARFFKYSISRTCRIQWWCLFFLFFVENTSFRQICSKKMKIVS